MREHASTAAGVREGGGREGGREGLREGMREMTNLVVEHILHTVDLHLHSHCMNWPVNVSSLSLEVHSTGYYNSNWMMNYDVIF